MSECHYCHQPILENQILCMNCGSQIKPLEVKRRLFGGKRKIYLYIQHPFLPEKKLIRVGEQKRSSMIAKGNMTLEPWL